LTELQAVVLGLVQGLGNFPPISSSAHPVFGSLAFNWEDPGLTFDIALHLGTLIAAAIHFPSIADFNGIHHRHGGFLVSGIANIGFLPSYVQTKTFLPFVRYRFAPGDGGYYYRSLVFSIISRCAAPVRPWADRQFFPRQWKF